MPQIELYVPANLATLFRDFADHDLLVGQPPLAMREDDPPELHTVVALIEQHNAGLEHEIVTPPML